jgi:predicted LPLAT superfamily acyltransferase
MTDTPEMASGLQDIDAVRARARLLGDMQNALEEGDQRWLSRTLAGMHPADASDALEAVGESAVLEVRMMLSGLEAASPISQERPNLR